MQQNGNISDEQRRGRKLMKYQQELAQANQPPGSIYYPGYTDQLRLEGKIPPLPEKPAEAPYAR